MEQHIGKIKTRISEFTISDGEISRIVKDALKNQGYDIEIEPKIDVTTQFFVGEKFKVFRTE